jgi:hypothetical protein
LKFFLLSQIGKYYFLVVKIYFKGIKMGKLYFSIIVLINIFLVGCSDCGDDEKNNKGKKIKIWNGTADTTWYTDNKEKTVFEISTAEQLAGLSLLLDPRFLDNGNYNMSGKTIKLVSDIVINDTTNWQNWGKSPPVNSWKRLGAAGPIFSVGTNGSRWIDARFMGIFDGNGHTISGIYIGGDDYRVNEGLFGYVSGTVKNLGVKASYIKGQYQVGGFVGLNRGEIKNCFFQGIVSGISVIGGFVGLNKGEISNSYFSGVVVGDNSETTGGFTGENSEEDSGEIIYSYYNAETSGQSDIGKGDGKTTDEMKLQSTYENWDFTDIWGINGSYPYLLIKN